MSFASDLTLAEMYKETEATNASLTDAERNIRYQKRRYQAEVANSGNSTGAFAALQALGVTQPAPIDEKTYATNRATFETALAVLVADGASPTQVHVTTVNTAYSALNTPHLGHRHYVAANKTAFESALATLVADGASPTQAHVTAANSAYTTFVGGLI